MKVLRQLKLVISCLLAILLVGGTGLPSPALWQCRSSSRVVSAAFVPAPNAMPCLMGSPMAPMPCCHPTPAAQSRSHGRQGLSAPACHPTLTALATASAPGLTETHSHWRQRLASLPSALPPPAAAVVSAPLTLSGRQRPPPTLGLPSPIPAYSFGLCAPPAA